MKPYLLALGAIFLWATLAFLSLQLSQVPPFLLVGLCLTIGSVCGLPWIKQWKVPWTTLALGVYGLFGYHLLLFLALRNAPPIEANLLNYLWPLLIVLLSPIFLKGYHLNITHIIAAVLGFFGALLIVTGGQISIAPENTLGYILAIAAAFVWASYSLMTKKVRSFPTAAIGLFCFVSGILSLICHWLLESRYQITAAEFLPLTLISVGPLGLAFFMWDRALKSGDPRIIGSLSYLTPMLSTLLILTANPDAFTWISGVAMVLIMSGAVVGAIANKK